MAGFGLDVNFVLSSVSYPLIEKVLNSTLPAPITAGSQTVAITDESLYVGAQIITGNPGTSDQEIVTVTAITANNFTATFANNHAQGEMVRGATFSAGQVTQGVVANMGSGSGSFVSPLWTQSEMLLYVRNVQNDYLERVRPIYNVTTVPLATGNPVASTPTDSIRLERVVIGGVALWPVSQGELDMSSQDSQPAQQAPTMWYQDKLNTSKFAVAPTPPVNLTAEEWYSQKGTTMPHLTDALIVPDMLWYAIKYGILALAFSKDGEMKDARRAAYCEKRYERCVAYGQKFMRSVQVEMDFSKLARAGV